MARTLAEPAPAASPAVARPEGSAKYAPRFKPSAERKGYAVAAAAAAAPFLKKCLPANVHNLLPLIKQWPSICPALAAFSCPKEVKLGVLKVAVANASVAQQLQFEAPTVLELARLATGQPLTKLVTLITPLQGAAPGLDKPESAPHSAAHPCAEAEALARLVAQLKDPQP